MFAFLHIARFKLLLIILACAAAAALVIFARQRPAHRQAKAAYTIGIIINKTELSEQGMHTLKEIVAQKINTLNKNNGIDGHPLRIIYIDDENSDKKLYELVRQSSEDTNLIAYVGCRGVSRTKILAPLLTERKIPLIGLYAFTNLFKDAPTLYTASVGVEEGELVLEQFFKAKGKRIGFIGENDHLLSKAFLAAIKNIVARNPELSITLYQSFPNGHIYNNESESRQLADSLRMKTDFIVFLSNPVSCNSFLDFMKKYDLRMPVYLGAPDFMLLDPTTAGYKAGEIYFINAFGIPGAQNMRMMEQFSKYYKAKKNINEVVLELALSGRIVDEIGLIHEAAQNKISEQNTPIREKINFGLTQYINGNSIYRGFLGDWYFTPAHAYKGESLFGWKPRNTTMMALAPIQYLSSDTGLQQRQVLYININIVEISQVSDDDGTFYATFYFEVNSPQQISIQNIDFTNAARNEINHEALIETKLIRSKKDSLGFKFYNNLYQVSGKFFFEPDLRNYPLDQQKFPISIQASNPNDVFLVQPSQKRFRDTIFKSEGWLYNEQYMGFAQDIISPAKNFYGQKRNIPYYKFSYMYIMKRARIDFFLKTLVPLLAILVITYFSVYIPLRQFEALAGIQVTALLSSIALYFSAYKPETQYATTSDRIFIFTYIMITTLIGTSILLYTLHHKQTPIFRLVRFYQRYVFPVVVLAFTIYVRWF
jgi:ABC-type branched-subunit amino acid transport system substrate-binding protein